MKTRVLCALLLLGGWLNVEAGEVAKGSIDEVVNLIGSEKLFALKMSSNSRGPCAGTWVKFKKSNFESNLESYNFAFSMATAALISGKKIRVHNYTNDSCDGVTFIGLYK